MDRLSLQNRNIVIAGAGATGRSVARYLDRHGIAWRMADASVDPSVPDAQQSSAVESLLPMHENVLCKADLVVLSPGIPRASSAVQAALDGGVDVIGDIELFAAEAGAPVLAVTGSNGKSTVVTWLEHALGRLGCRALACGNIGLPALDSLEQEADVYVLELSSYQLESTRSLAPCVAAVLNVSDDHLDRYDSIDHYAAVKRRVYDGAAWRLCNLDDERTWPDPQGTEAPEAARGLYGFTTREMASLPRDMDRLFALQRREDGNLWLVRVTEDACLPLLAVDRLPLPGRHNVANALAVLAVLDILIETGMASASIENAAEALLDFRGLPHRTELVGEKHGVRWFNDSKGTNVDAACKAIDAMPGPVVLIAGGIGKGADFQPLREPVGRIVKALVLLGRDRERLADVLDGLAPIHRVDTLEAAVELAGSLAEQGDVVLLSPACSSFDMFANFEARGDRFRALVGEALAA